MALFAEQFVFVEKQQQQLVSKNILKWSHLGQKSFKDKLVVSMEESSQPQFELWVLWNLWFGLIFVI